MNYRYFRVAEPDFSGRALLPAAGTLTVDFDDIVKHGDDRPPLSLWRSRG